MAVGINSTAHGVILHSSDGGITWTQQYAAPNTNSTFNSVAFGSSTAGIAVGPGGIVFTNNGGVTWNVSRTAGSFSGIYAIAMPDALHAWITSDNGRIYATADGGNTWNEQNTPLSGSDISLFGIDFIDAGTGVAVGENGTIIAMVGGGSWFTRNSGTTDNLFDVSFSNTRHGHATGAFGTVLVSNDFGFSWQHEESGTELGLFAVSSIDPTHAWTVGWFGTIRAHVSPPSIIAPANVSAGNLSGLCAAVVGALPSFTAFGNPAPAVSVSGIPPNNLFPVGSTTVTGTASNGVAPDATATYTVTVLDVQNPGIASPPSMFVEAAGPTGAVVTFPAFTATDNCPAVSVTANPVSGSLFPLGTTLVVGTAKDAAGNQATASFSVTVRDTTPPSIGDAPNVDVPATGPAGAVVTYVVPSATDLVDAAPTVSCLPPSSTTFVIGNTIVVCNAMDQSGNTASKSFTIHVQSAGEQVQHLAAIVADPALGLGTSLADKLADVETNIAAGNQRAACNGLSAFLRELRAQTGKAIEAGDLPYQSGGLASTATRIRDVLAC